MTEFSFCDPVTKDITMLARERWSWEAIYTDGTYICQFDDRDGTFHQFREIQQDRLAAFCMVAINRPPIIMHWVPGRKLIHFYQNTRLHVGTPNEVFIRLYCFGYETGSDKMIVVIMPDDQIRVVRDASEIQIV